MCSVIELARTHQFLIDFPEDEISAEDSHKLYEAAVVLAQLLDKREPADLAECAALFACSIPPGEVDANIKSNAIYERMNARAFVAAHSLLLAAQ